MTRTLAVPPQPHGPLAQPAGAAVVGPATRPPPGSPRARAAAAVVEARAFAGSLRVSLYDVAARRLEAHAATLERALAREPIEPVDARIRRLGGGA